MSSHQSDNSAWVSVFRRHMDEMMSVICHLRAQGGDIQEFSPLMDIYETADHFVIELDLPGFAETDFSTVSNGQMVRIDGCKRHEKQEPSTSYICLERHSGRFTRVVEVPPEFDPATMKKLYNRGVLSISIPKR
jgi:HSP20 family protein